jgi:hypothetical protein
MYFLHLPSGIRSINPILKFLGPDAIQDHKTKILNARATGIGTLSPEGTGDLDYILRAARV